MTAVYEKFFPFYDLEYGAREDDLPFYLDQAETHGGPVLEIGTGTGRVAFELARAGHKVWGIDNSAGMLELANDKLAQMPKRLGARVHFARADMRRFHLGRTFNLCIVPFRTFLHNLTLKDQLATLRCIAGHLQPGGILALDLFVPLYQVLSQTRWRLQVPPEDLAPAKSAIGIEAVIVHDPVRQLLTITNHYRRQGEKTVAATMKYRYLHRPEMELLLQVAGFKKVECFGGFSGQPYDYYSGIMCFVAKKLLG